MDLLQPSPDIYSSHWQSFYYLLSVCCMCHTCAAISDILTKFVKRVSAATVHCVHTSKAEGCGRPRVAVPVRRFCTLERQALAPQLCSYVQLYTYIHYITAPAGICIDTSAETVVSPRCPPAVLSRVPRGVPLLILSCWILTINKKPNRNPPT